MVVTYALQRKTSLRRKVASRALLLELTDKGNSDSELTDNNDINNANIDPEKNSESPNWSEYDWNFIWHARVPSWVTNANPNSESKGKGDDETNGDRLVAPGRPAVILRQFPDGISKTARHLSYKLKDVVDEARQERDFNANADMKKYINSN